MNKKILKVIAILIYILFIFCMFSNTYATITNQFKGSSPSVGVDKIQDIIKAVLTITRTVGVFIAVAILMILACKYMIASAGDRADIKKHAISYVIGAIILFATSGIAEILKNLIDGAFDTQ